MAIISLALLCILATGIDGSAHCCQEKKVGDTNYKLLSKGDTSAFGCADSCIYEATQNPGSKVCFKPGNLPVTCIKENGCKCGIKKKGTKRIIGGQEAEVMEYPWITFIQSHFAKGPTENCGGSLIASEWVLTAAHCLVKPDGERVQSVVAGLGFHNTYKGVKDPLEQRKGVNVSENIPHPYYQDSLPNENDIALLRLSEPVDLDLYTPVCLPDMGADFTGMSGWLAGWGSNSSSWNNDTQKGEFTSPFKLMEKEMQIVGRKDCSSNWKNQDFPRTITSGMICANSTTPTGAENAAQCSGDSGGPLTVEMDGKHILVGDVSFGPRPCEKEGTIGVYGNVAFYRDWIDFTMNKDGKPSLCSE